MSLILTLTDRQGRGRGETRTLNGDSLTIGRGSDNDWVLADPERHLSKTHCQIRAQGGQYVLTDLSTNGVYINGSSEPTQRDGETVLGDGDTLRLGEYLISVAVGAAARAPAAADPFGLDFPAEEATRIRPFGGSGDGRGDPLAGDPLDDPFGAPAPRAAAPFPYPTPMPPPTRGEDPFDLAAHSELHAPEPDDDLFRPKAALDVWQGGSQSDHADAPNLAFVAPKAIMPRGLDDLDIDALLGDTPPGQAPSPVAWSMQMPQQATSPGGLSDSLDDLLGDPTPSRVPFPSPAPAPAPVAASAPIAVPQPVVSVPAPAPVPPPAPIQPVAVQASPPVQAPASVQVAPPPVQAAAPPVQAPPPVARPAQAAAAPQPAGLLAAFLEGAGVPDLPLGNRDPEALMRAAGEVFHVMVEGLREVLMSRAAIKNELRVEQTVLRARNNNALKFSVTPEEALAALLVPDRPGYKPPLEATREAFDDIKSHELAVMAGVQTALMGLLKRFDPAALETRLQPGKLDSILPGNRKARFWELFCMTYKELAREAEDDFQSVFGREFARAYDAQAQKL